MPQWTRRTGALVAAAASASAAACSYAERGDSDYRSIEPELFARQDEIKTALDKSQDLIRG